MSLHPQPPNPIPEETARVAHAAFPNANTYMRMRDQPAEAPARLALVTIMQFAEGLSDRQAATAV